LDQETEAASFLKQARGESADFFENLVAKSREEMKKFFGKKNKKCERANRYSQRCKQIYAARGVTSF